MASIDSSPQARNESDFVLQSMEERRMEEHADVLLGEFEEYLRSRFGQVFFQGRKIHMRGLRDEEYFEVETTVTVPSIGEKAIFLRVGSASRSENVGWFSMHEPDGEELESLGDTLAKSEPDADQLEFDFMN